jgi:ketosteroid isomerase-like protein
MTEPVPASPAAVFDRLVHGVGDHRWAELPGLYAEQTHVVHPHDPLRGAPLVTREDLDRHFRRGAEVLGEIRFTPAAITVHQTADPEVIVAEFEYRGTAPGTGEPFAIPNVFVMRVRDGLIVTSRDYADHLEIARVLGSLDELVAAAAQRGADGGRGREGAVPAGSWQDRARQLYESVTFDGDARALETAERELDAVEADLALARGRIMHARLLAGAEADDAELEQFERSAELYARAGNGRGEAEALFWAATFRQVARNDNDGAVPLLERARELAAAAGDSLTLSYVVRHLGFADEAAGRLDQAREWFAQSLALRRELGFDRGVAAALLALAELARVRGDRAEAEALLAEAEEIARRIGAGRVLHWIEQERAEAVEAAADR